MVECSDERASGFDNEVWASWDHLSFELRLVVERLLAPLDAVTRWAVVVLKTDESPLWFRQGRQHLALLQLRWSRPLGPWSGESARQPLGQLQVDCHGIGGLMVVDWRKALVMLQPPYKTDPVFGTGAASLYLPAFQNLAARVGLAPTPPGLTGRHATLTLPGNGAAGRILTCIVPLRRRMPDIFDHGSNLKMVGMAGFPPAASRSQAGRSED